MSGMIGHVVLLLVWGGIRGSGRESEGWKECMITALMFYCLVD